MQNLGLLAAAIDAQAASTNRLVVAIAGAPGSGKSTLVVKLQKALVQQNLGLGSQIVSMDGFHLNNAILRQRGQLPVKGAPETFDVEGFASLLQRIKTNDEDVFAPLFNRDLDSVIGTAVEIKTDNKVILVEGNYLLLDQEPWRQLQQYFDMTIFIKVTAETLEQRLIQRWLDQGFDQSSAASKVRTNDLPNGRIGDNAIDSGRLHNTVITTMQNQHKVSPLQCQSWQALNDHFQSFKDIHLKQLFAQSNERAEQYSVQFDTLLVDYSKHRFNEETMALLLTLTEEMQLKDSIEAMFSGKVINQSEQRPALHTALRAADTPLIYNAQPISPQVDVELEKNGTVE